MIVTVEDLKTLDACEGQVVLFRKTFGEAVEVTRENLTRAQEVGLNLNLWGQKTFGKAYEEATALAWKAYDEAVAPAWKAYAEAVALAAKACEEAEALAWKAYVEATAPAKKAYGEAVAHAWKAYEEAVAHAWKAYEEAVIEIILTLAQGNSR